MTLCLVSPRFHPVIGGVEIYLRNIAEYCSSHIKTIVITSNLKNVPKSLFEKTQFIDKKYEILANNIEIIRANTLNNLFLRILFYINQYLNKKIEILFDKELNPNLYLKNKTIFKSWIKNSQKLSNTVIKSFILQRYFFNPYISQIYNILKKVNQINKIKIIHSSPIYLPANICAFRFAMRKGIPFICTPLYHINPYADYIFYPSFQHILKNSDAIIACTDTEKKFYRKYGIEGSKIHVIPPGIEPMDYKKPNIKKFRKNFNIPEDAPLLLFMGRKDYGKGVFHSIYALKYLIKNFKNLKLIIAGPETREYKIFFKRLPSELKAHIINLGIVDNEVKSNMFANCDVFLLPSLDDAFGIVYLEAWLYKKPVIGALGGNVEGLINNNVNGFLVPFKDIKYFAKKIEFLLNNDAKKQELGQNGYNKLINSYLLENTNKRILNLYEKFM